MKARGKNRLNRGARLLGKNCPERILMQTR
jgi:hypothetical protein